MQEIVIFSDKSSIEEELTRLASHISQFLTLIKESLERLDERLFKDRKRKTDYFSFYKLSSLSYNIFVGVV